MNLLQRDEHRITPVALFNGSGREQGLSGFAARPVKLRPVAATGFQRAPRIAHERGGSKQIFACFGG